MGYNHTLVSELEQRTKIHIGKSAAQISTVNESDPPVDMVDGIAVTPELAKFCAEIRKFNRHVKFGLGHRAAYDWRNGVNLKKELYVYMDGHVYAMARIGYGDYSVRTSGGSKYMVSARMIANEKFRDSNDQYHMAMAETMERAIKNVKKYLRIYSPMECAQMSFSAVRDKFAHVGSTISGEANHAQYDVLNSNHIRAELFHMLDLGYEFLSQEFREQIVKWREKYITHQEAKSRALHVHYVNVRLHREEMMCDVITVLDAHKSYRIEPTSPVVTYKMEDLPENIAGSLAALSMVEDGHYVDSVGLRVDSTTFWVQG